MLAGTGLDGNQWKLRKFACADSRNTTEAVYAFLRYPQNLSKEAEEVAAQNLLRNTYDYGLTPPPELIKKAGETYPAPATNFVLMSGGAPNLEAVEKVAAQDEEDVYAIHSAEDVALALDYFYEYESVLDGWDKRAMAEDLVASAEVFGCSLPARIEKYAAAAYAPDLTSVVVLRQQMLHPTDNSEEAHTATTKIAQAYHRLLQSASVLDPEKFAEQLSALDERAGLSGKVPDPVFSTFGKVAEEKEKPLFSHLGTIVYKDQVAKLAVRGLASVREQFGAEVADGFAANPLAVFKSMPQPQKILLARLASQLDAEG